MKLCGTYEDRVVSVEVELLAFGGGAIRTVDIPRVALEEDRDRILGLVFKYGQNDFQPKPFPSVSVGDVIRLDGERYRVEPIGFQKVEA